MGLWKQSVGIVIHKGESCNVPALFMTWFYKSINLVMVYYNMLFGHVQKELGE